MVPRREVFDCVQNSPRTYHVDKRTRVLLEKLNGAGQLSGESCVEQNLAHDIVLIPGFRMTNTIFVRESFSARAEYLGELCRPSGEAAKRWTQFNVHQRLYSKDTRRGNEQTPAIVRHSFLSSPLFPLQAFPSTVLTTPCYSHIRTKYWISDLSWDRS